MVVRAVPVRSVAMELMVTLARQLVPAALAALVERAQT
jgi:hypothetical protein